jgi:hypothetical protein
MTTDTAPLYNVQCLRGHVAEVLHGTDLEKRCIERAKTHIAALPISRDDCYQCIGDDQDRREVELDRAGSVCLNNSSDHDLFCGGCLTQEEIAKMFPRIPDSQYEGQMRMAFPW